MTGRMFEPLMSKDGKTTSSAAAGLLWILWLGVCATSTASLAVTEARAETAAVSKQGAYPAVEDLPPPREKPALTLDERAKLKKELIDARDRQTSRVKASEGAARTNPAKP
jgi:hypothetical protein